MEYIQKIDNLATVLSEDITNAVTLAEFTQGDYNKSFYLGWTFNSALKHKVLKAELAKDIANRVLQLIQTKLYAKVKALLVEYNECMEKATVNSVDATNYVLTILGKEETTSTDMEIIAFYIATLLKSSI